MPSPRIAVVGGGITGLAAAHAIATDPREVGVVVVERDERVGGKLLTTPFAGHPAIDEGPDAFLARLPWATELAVAVGLAESLVDPAVGSAAVWWDRLHPIPNGLLLGMPTDVMALARSGLITVRGKLRAATEPLRPRSSIEHDSLGRYVRARFGDQVHERLVDPLVGSIYAADTDRFSLAAVAQIGELAARERSVLLAGRNMQRPAVPGPVFHAPRRGMGALANATAAAIAAAGGEIRLGQAAVELARDGDLWRVDGETFDGVILCAPASATAALLDGIDTDLARALRTIEAAAVAIVTLAIDPADWPDNLTGMSGYLVPKPVQRLVTATSFGSQKWPHWTVDGDVVLRISLGRDGLPVLDRSDESLLGAAIDEVGHHLGLTLQPRHARVSRWPSAFPQYRPHHADHVATMEELVPPGLALAGASYHGIGVPACIRSGQQAAQRVLAHALAVAE